MYGVNIPVSTTGYAALELLLAQEVEIHKDSEILKKPIVSKTHNKSQRSTRSPFPSDSFSQNHSLRKIWNR